MAATRNFSVASSPSDAMNSTAPPMTQVLLVVSADMPIARIATT